jgi:hypothetical protein
VSSAWEDRLRAVVGGRAAAFEAPLDLSGSKPQMGSIDELHTVYPTGLVGEYHLLQLSHRDVVPGSVRVILKSNGESVYTLALVDDRTLYVGVDVTLTVDYTYGCLAVSVMDPYFASTSAFDVEVSYKYYVF